MTLLDTLCDPSVVSITRHGQMEPMAGPGTPIAASVYEGKTYITTDNALVPAPGDEGAFTEFERDTSGQPVRDTSVQISSVAAEVSRMEEALWQWASQRGVKLPYIGYAPVSEEDMAVYEKVVDKVAKTLESTAEKDAAGGADGSARANIVREMMDEDLRTHEHRTSWTLSHRGFSAELRMATMGEGDLDTTPNGWVSGQYTTMLTEQARDIDKLVALQPNAALFGYWFSTNMPMGMRQARTTSGEIIGYRAAKVLSPMTKVSELTYAAEADLHPYMVAGAKGKKIQPSAVGLGSITTEIKGQVVTHFSCGLILSRYTTSLTALRSLLAQSRTPEKSLKALVAIAVAGMVLSARNGDIRSFTNLLELNKVWYVRRHGDAKVHAVDIDEDALLDECAEAINEAVAEGIFAPEPVLVRRNPEEVRIAAKTLARSLALGK